MGPLLTPPLFNRAEAFIDAGVAAGAELVVDGPSVEVETYEGGYSLDPCLFDRVKPGMSIYQ